MQKYKQKAAKNWKPKMKFGIMRLGKHTISCEINKFHKL